MKTANLILGLCLGACLGAISGLLFAPHKGTVTRKLITRKGEKYVDLLEEKVDDFLETIDQRIDNVKKEVAGFVKKERLKAHEISRGESLN